jgi:WD40 repeat protein
VSHGQGDSKLVGSRRWFQFSLRTLLLVTTLVAVWMGLLSYRIRLSPANITGLRQMAQINEDVYKLHLSPDHQRVAFVRWQKPVEIRSASDLRLLDTVDGPLIGFAFSPNPDVIACCENSKIAEIRNLRTGTALKLNTGNDQPGMVFSADGTLLATGGYGNAVRLWRVSDGMLLNVLDVGPDTGGLSPVFSPDGKTLAVGNRNSTTMIFDVATGNKLCELSKGVSQELQFDPSGNRLAVAYCDGSVALWDISAGGKLLAQRYTGAVEMYTVDWSPNGELLAAAGLHGDLLVLDGKDLQELARVPWQEWVISVQFSPDGSRLLTAGGQQKFGDQRWVAVWRTSPDLFETILGIARWVLGAMLLLLVVVLPITRSLRSMRNRDANKPIDDSPTQAPNLVTSPTKT